MGKVQTAHVAVHAKPGPVMGVPQGQRLAESTQGLDLNNKKTRMETYKLQLEAFKLERDLGLEHSEQTAELLDRFRGQPNPNVITQFNADYYNY